MYLSLRTCKKDQQKPYFDIYQHEVAFTTAHRAELQVSL